MDTPNPASDEPSGDAGDQAAHVEDPPPQRRELRPLSFSEMAFKDAYIEALKNGLSAAADANGALITASLAIATLYGTLIGLVSPKTQTSPFIVVVPMIPLVGAFLAAVYGKTRGISFEPTERTDEIRQYMTSVVEKQRCGIRVAVTLLTIGLIAGGYILADVYGGPKPKPTTVTVYLTGEGQATISELCKKSVASIAGSVGTSPVAPQDIVIMPAPHSACAGQRLELTPQEVAAIK
jgi:hypothetical protein